MDGRAGRVRRCLLDTKMARRSNSLTVAPRPSHRAQAYSARRSLYPVDPAHDFVEPLHDGEFVAHLGDVAPERRDLGVALAQVPTQGFGGCI